MAWNNNFDDFKPALMLNLNTPSRPRQQPKQTGTSEILKIMDISPGHSVVNIVGLVICKDGPKSIISKKGIERHLLSFTVRDSDTGFINMTLWGNEGFIMTQSQTVQIGDIVQISNAQAQAKLNNGMDDKYRPWTPSGFNLNISENHGTIELYNGWDVDNYKGLLHMPNKASNDYYTLDDINVNGMSLQGEHVNLLAAVKTVGPVRNFTTKTGKASKKCEVLLFDETCSKFTLDLWSLNVDLSQTWIPHQTVIFAADVKIIYNDYKSSMIAVADTKTIFTIDPDTQEAYSLHSFAMTDTNFGNDNSFTEGNGSFNFNEPEPNLDSIKDIYTIENIKKKSFSQDKDSEYGIAYVFLSSFDIDSEDKAITRRICEKCRRVLKKDSNFLCLNPLCNGESDVGTNCLDYSIYVSVSDHTGTIDFCNLSNTVSEAILACKADDINQLNLERLTQIKWNYLLERCKIVFKIHKSHKDSSSRVRILSLTIADPNEVLNYFSTL